MTKTPTSHRETKLGILKQSEIEKVIIENLALVQKYIIRHYADLIINTDSAKKLHAMLGGNLYFEAGQYRKHDVQLGFFEPPIFYELPVLMKNWEADLAQRIKSTKTQERHIENCAWLMHRFLWIHPFFDYNGRVARLLGELYLIQNQLPVVDFRQTKRKDFVAAVKLATAQGDLSQLQQLLVR
ncbi:MAG: Fic family protein [Candidatus Kerfeldbacteria bacterium]|nr:Fic family protein [Candidatus Kerfeldbacteria bacterium]